MKFLKPNAYFTFRAIRNANVLPYNHILQSWMRNGFRPENCLSALREIVPETELRLTYFDEEALLRGDYFLTSKASFPDAPNRWHFGVENGTSEGSASELELEQVRGVADALRWASTATDSKLIRKRFKFIRDDFFAESDRNSLELWRPIRGPGIYRREHASLVIRSSTTQLVIDPITLNRALPMISRVPYFETPEICDAVLVTHGHGDHWHIPSLLYATAGNPDTPVVVPSVPRRNFLTPETFSESLECIGQKTIEAKWNSTIRIGDIDIEVLPFLGEQPSREGPGPIDGVRNQGNCYRITTPEFSVMLLVDAGAEPAGDMVAAVKESCRRFGPVDVVMSCLRTFDSPFFGGLLSYFAALPLRQLQELYVQFQGGILPSTTAGTAGAARLCRAAGARYYLPYANGFEGVACPITDIGWGNGEISEEQALLQLEAALTSISAPSKVLRWNPGDAVTFEGKEARIEKYVESRPGTRIAN